MMSTPLTSPPQQQQLPPQSASLYSPRYSPRSLHVHVPPAVVRREQVAQSMSQKVKSEIEHMRVQASA
jgi:hypothetical protein